MMRPLTSLDSLTEASRNRARFSGHGQAMGAAGTVQQTGNVSPEDHFLVNSGDAAIINPQEHGFRPIRIGMAWDNLTSAGEKRSLTKKAAGKIIPGVTAGVDLDLGCLYELQSGERGAVQAFGELFGRFDGKPFIALSGDEQTGDAPGEDEYIIINGAQWPEFKRVMFYAYIYSGTPSWDIIRPVIHIRVPGEPVISVQLSLSDQKLPVCAIVSLENVRNGIKAFNHSEFFSGHPEMDRAFGYGIVWEDGKKI